MSLLFWDKSLQAWPVSASASTRLAMHSVVFCFNCAVVSGIGLVTSSVLRESSQFKELVSATGYGHCRLGETELRVSHSHVCFSRKWGNSAEDFLVCLRHSHAFAAVSQNSVSCQFFLYLSVQQFASKMTF